MHQWVEQQMDARPPLSLSLKNHWLQFKKRKDVPTYMTIRESRALHLTYMVNNKGFRPYRKRSWKLDKQKSDKSSQFFLFCVFNTLQSIFKELILHVDSDKRKYYNFFFPYSLKGSRIMLPQNMTVGVQDMPPWNMI